MHMLATPEPLPNGALHQEVWQMLRDKVSVAGVAMCDLVSEWPGNGTPTVWKVVPDLAIGVCKLGWKVLHVVPFAGKLARRQLMSRWPSETTMMRFRAEAKRRRGDEQPDDPDLLLRVGRNPFRAMPATNTPNGFAPHST